MQLRIEGNLSELKAIYQALSSRGFKLDNCKLYANAKPGEDRRGMKRQIPPFLPSQITNELVESHGDREFRLYGSIELSPIRYSPPSPYDAVLGGEWQPDITFDVE
jgi:hypothetical protein